MNFCDKCGNMYYIKLKNEDGDQLTYYCRKCGNEDNTLIDDEKSLCVSKTHISNNTQLYSQVINKYTKLDPTLPRITNIKCPNVNCSGKTSKDSESKDGESKTQIKNNEIIYLRYDDTNLKYVYLCCACDNVWKT
tara:strand:+ start:45 stop:449 length:405 start_codon:yes stop_codon:yes gene_type:complete